MAKSQSVYIIKSVSDLIKIGISFNPDGRLRGLQTANGEKLKLIYVEPLQKGLARFVERSAHHILSHKRVEGEWFNASTDEAIYVVKTATWIVRDCFDNGSIDPFKNKARIDAVVRAKNKTENADERLSVTGWLKHTLSDGPKKQSSMLDEGIKFGFSKSAIYRQMPKVGVVGMDGPDGIRYWRLKNNNIQSISKTINTVDEWLIQTLSDGPRLGSDIIHEAETLTIPWRTVYDAKTRLGIVGERSGRISTWALPSHLRIVRSES
jgi:hypothetical protein